MRTKGSDSRFTGRLLGRKRGAGEGARGAGRSGELRIHRRARHAELLQGDVLAEIDLDRVPLLALGTPVDPLGQRGLAGEAAVLELHELQLLDDLAVLLRGGPRVAAPLADPADEVVEGRR